METNVKFQAKKRPTIKLALSQRYEQHPICIRSQPYHCNRVLHTDDSCAWSLAVRLISVHCNVTDTSAEYLATLHKEGTILIRNVRKTLDTIAEHNEDAALALMRAAERTGDEVLRQQMLRVIHSLNQDALDLRVLRDDIALGNHKRA